MDQIFLPIPFKLARKAFLVTAIKARWGTMRAFAEHLGITPACLSQMVSGKAKSANVEAALAELTGYPTHVLFPPQEKAA